MRFCSALFVVLFLSGVNAHRFVRYEGTQCVTPLRVTGTCVSLRFCPEILSFYKQLPQHSATQYSKVLREICGNEVTQDNYPVVCCTHSKDTPIDEPNNRVTNPQTTTPFYENIFTQTSTVVESTTKSVTETDRSSGNQKPSSTSCRGPNLEEGLCKPLLDCSQLLNHGIDNPTDENFKTFLKKSNVECGSEGTNVCCPIITERSAQNVTSTTTSRTATATGDAPRRLPTEDEGCGFVNSRSTKVVGGRDSDMGAWPWLVLIGYDVFSLAPFKCGGSLITVRHVLTAAHCIRDDLSFVRLGEYDLSTETETQHVDINVNRVAKHPRFGTKDYRSDIAVLYLERNAEISEMICPICLPIQDKLRSKSYVNYNPFVAGWGRTEEGGRSSNILQELQIPVLENSQCYRSYELNGRLRSEQQFDNSVLCAGYLVGGKDTCQGDSGGPLMVPELYKGITRYYVIGIVSYGIGCARSGIPGVYTSTQHFMDWIVEKVAET